MFLQHFVKKIWYDPSLSVILWPFIPLSLLYESMISIRKVFYHTINVLSHEFHCLLDKGSKTKSQSLPIVVVGNITVGGTGKTPCVIHIAELLKEKGYKPGVITRGYKGKYSSAHVIWVDFRQNSMKESKIEAITLDQNTKEIDSNIKSLDPEWIGDEAFLLAKKLLCPVVVSANRKKAIRVLESSKQVDVIISDDGLQHYAMTGDIEIVLVDGLRRFGNGLCLPLGPLREPLSRLGEVDLRIANLTEGGFPTIQEYDMDYQLVDELESLLTYQQSVKAFHSENDHKNNTVLSIQQIKDTLQNVHAVAGLAHPERFFASLKNHYIRFNPHPFPDHYSYQECDLNFSDDLPILMTEKDAVKCIKFQSKALCQKIFVVKMRARLNALFDARLLLLLQEKMHG